MERGMLINLWKRKGESNTCSNSRGVIVADQVGKLYRKHVRQHLAIPYEQTVRQTQCAGVKHPGSDFVSHMSRLDLELAKMKRRAAALIVVGPFCCF